MQQPSLAIDIHIYRKGNVVNHRYWDVRSTGKLVTPLVVAAKLSAEWFCPNCLLDLTQIVYDRRSQYLLCPRCGTGLPWQHTTLQIEPQCILCTGDCLLGHRHKLEFQADKRPNPLRFTHDVGLSDKRVAHYAKEEQKLQEELKASFAKLCFMRDRLQPRDVQEGGMHFHIGLNIKVGNHFFSFEQQLQNATPKGVGCSTNCPSHAVPGCDSYHLPSILLGDDQRITSKVVAFRSLSIQEDKATLVVFPGLISPALLCTARGMKLNHHSRSSSSSPRASLGMSSSSSSSLHSPIDPSKPDLVIDMAKSIISKTSSFTDHEKTRLIHALIDGFHLNDIFCQSSYQTYTETGWDTGDDSFCTDPFASELDNSEIDSSMDDPDSSSSATNTTSTNKSSKTGSDIKPMTTFSPSGGSSSGGGGGSSHQSHHPFSTMLSNSIMGGGSSSSSSSNSASGVSGGATNANNPSISSSASSSTTSSMPPSLSSNSNPFSNSMSSGGGGSGGGNTSSSSSVGPIFSFASSSSSSSSSSPSPFSQMQQQQNQLQQQHQQQLQGIIPLQHLTLSPQPQPHQQHGFFMQQHFGAGMGSPMDHHHHQQQQHQHQQQQQQQQHQQRQHIQQMAPLNFGSMGGMNNPALGFSGAPNISQANSMNPLNNNSNSGNNNNSSSGNNNPSGHGFDPFHRPAFS